MSATCSGATPSLGNNVGIDFQKTMSADGLTVFTTLTDFSQTKINYQKSTNGGLSFTSNGAAFWTTDIPGVLPNSTLTQGDLVCDSTGLTQCLFAIGNGTAVANTKTLYVRITTNGGVSWGTPITLSNNVFSLTNVHAKHSTTGTITEVIWTQKGLSTDTFFETKTSSSNDNTTWLQRTIRAGVDTAFPQITARDDGSEVYATLVNNAGVSVVEVWKRATFAGVWALNYTVLSTPTNFPQISCSGTAARVAVTFFVGSGTNAPLYCAVTDNSGGSWTETLMSDVFPAPLSQVTPYRPAFVLTDGSHSVVVSNNGNMIYVVWSCNNQTDIRVKRRTLGTWSTSQLLDSNLSSFAIYPHVVCSANGAVPTLIFTRDVTTNREVTQFTSATAGETYFSAIVVSFGSPNSTTRTYDNSLTVSTLSNNTSIMFGDSNSSVNFINWARVCTASSNVVTVTRTFNPTMDFWNTGNNVIYTITVPAYANSDYSLSGIIDMLLMSTQTGPATLGSVTFVSLAFPAGAHIGSATTGGVISNPAPMTFTPTGGPLILSTSSVASVLILTLNYLIVNLSGADITYFASGIWNNPGNWSGTSTFTTYQGVASTMTSSTGSLRVTDPPCVAEGTLVKLLTGENRKIEDLKKNDLLKGIDGAPVQLQSLIKIRRQTRNFIRIDGNRYRDSIEPNKPLLICQNHPVMIYGECVMPQEIGEKVILSEPKTIYTLITSHRDFVQMQGINVATWSEVGWENFVSNDRTGSFIDYEHISD